MNHKDRSDLVNTPPEFRVPASNPELGSRADRLRRAVKLAGGNLAVARQATRTAPSFPPGEGCDALSAPDRAAASAREQAILVQLRTEPTHPLPAKLRPSSEVAPLQPR